MNKKTVRTKRNEAAVNVIHDKKRPYGAPSIEVTYIQLEGNLLAGSGVKVIAKPEVENWVETEESSDEWLGF